MAPRERARHLTLDLAQRSERQPQELPQNVVVTHSLVAQTDVVHSLTAQPQPVLHPTLLQLVVHPTLLQLVVHPTLLQLELHPTLLQLELQPTKLQPEWHETRHPLLHPWNAQPVSAPPRGPETTSVSLEQFTIDAAASVAKPESATNITCCESIAIFVISLPVVDARRLSTSRAIPTNSLARSERRETATRSR